MKRSILALLLALILIPSLSFAAATPGTCAVTVATSTTSQARIPDSVTVIASLTCVGGSAGAFPATVIPLAGVSNDKVPQPYNLYGYYLYQVGRTPGALTVGGAAGAGTAPQASYTVTVTDVQGFALDLALLTTNGSATAAQLTGVYSTGTVYPVIRSVPTVAITANNVGSANIVLDLIFKAF